MQGNMSPHIRNLREFPANVGIHVVSELEYMSVNLVRKTIYRSESISAGLVFDNFHLEVPIDSFDNGISSTLEGFKLQVQCKEGFRIASSQQSLAKLFHRLGWMPTGVSGG